MPDSSLAHPLTHGRHESRSTGNQTLDWITEGAQKPVAKRRDGDVVRLFETLLSCAWYGVVTDDPDPKTMTATMEGF